MTDHKEQRNDAPQAARRQPVRLTDVFDGADRLLHERRPSDAAARLKAARALIGQDPTSQATFAFLLAHACCRAGQVDEAVAALGTGLDTEGVFWWPRLLREFPGVGALLTAHPGFEELIALSGERWRAAQEATAEVEAIVKKPACPIRGVAYVFHGATAAHEEFARLWSNPARRAGLALVVPRGTIQTCTGMFGWEPERAREAALAAHETACRHGLGDLPRVFAGFCQGAALAIAESFGGSESDLRPRGLVAIAPPYVATTDAGLARAVENGFRVSVLRGEWDWFSEPTDRFAALVKEAGARPHVARMPRVGHAVAQFARHGTEALRFAFGD